MYLNNNVYIVPIKYRILQIQILKPIIDKTLYFNDQRSYIYLQIK